MIGLRHVVHTPATGAHSLESRRKEIRRRRHSPIRSLASTAGWAAIILLTAWLLLSGLFGFPGA